MISDEEHEILTDFVDGYVVSFEAWDILVYFSTRGQAVVSAEELADDVGRRPEDLVRAARGLEERGVLVGGEGEEDAWKLTSDPAARRGLDIFVRSIADHQERLSVLTRLLENLSI